MSEAKKPSCGKCKYWVAHEKDGNLGDCHRFPPQLVASGDYNEVTSQFPFMLIDDWCGEFAVEVPSAP